MSEAQKMELQKLWEQARQEFWNAFKPAQQ